MQVLSTVEKKESGSTTPLILLVRNVQLNCSVGRLHLTLLVRTLNRVVVIKRLEPSERMASLKNYISIFLNISI